MSKWVSFLMVAWAVAVALVTSVDPRNSSWRRNPSGPAGLAYVYWRNATQRALGSVVPRPKSITYHNATEFLELSSGLRIVNLLRPSCSIVDLALDRYLRNPYDDSGPESKDDPLVGRRNKVGKLDTIELEGVGKFACELMPHSQMDEAYNLTVARNEDTGNHKVLMRARSSWGLIRALETLSQLVFNLRLDDKGSSLLAINVVDIEDEPRFKHRGFMLDTARHYVPVDTILTLLEAMAIDKLNVFHWHIVDDQSFAYVSQTYPQLSQKGAFKPQMVYSARDVKMVIAYAALRGIRVIPELDTPGHSYSMRHIPALLTECYDPKTGQKNGDFGPVDPTRESAFQALDKLLGELGSLFHDSHFFAGGDEVDFDCWKSNPNISDWMRAHRMEANYTALSNYYMQRLYKLIKSHEKTMIVWQEVYDMGANLTRDVVVNVWKYIDQEPAYMAQLANVVADGYQAILSSCWYLNYIDYGQDWIKYYECEPHAKPVMSRDAHLVIGGEICMWTEFVDQTNLLSRSWPRASAAAERLWSPREANATAEFLHRLEQHRCHLLSRGIKAEPVNGPGYC